MKPGSLTEAVVCCFFIWIAVSLFLHVVVPMVRGDVLDNQILTEIHSGRMQ